jgi:type VI secretion system protein ImpK
MAAGDSDDPFAAPSDGSVVRPRPGAGRRGRAEPFISPGDSGGTRLSGTRLDGTRREGTRTAATRTENRAEPHGTQFGDFTVGGPNALLQAATPLLVLAGRLRTTRSHLDVGGLRRHTLTEIRRFEDRARAASVPSETVVAARYALCAALDEAVLSTPWGMQSEWAAQTLLVQLHREAWGGEKFFDMLDRISRDPPRHIDLMELQYACIALGFNGKFQVLDHGQAQLDDLQHELYRKIRAYRGTAESELSPHWRGVVDRRNPVIRYVPWWVVGALMLAVLTGGFGYFYNRLGTFAAPVNARLAGIGLSDFTAPVEAAPSTGPGLKGLLAADEQRGVLSVEEHGARTLVTLSAPDLFASGSAQVNRNYYEPLRHLASALDQVPGRVMVVGHTDDSPLRSLRYRDNYELSRERAVQVVELLKPAIGNPARLEWTGVGSSQPRYRPESTPENRAKNRRVEIIHVREVR